MSVSARLAMFIAAAAIGTAMQMALPVVAAAQDTYVIRHVVKTGLTSRYRTTVTMDIAPADSTPLKILVEMTSKEVVSKLFRDGSWQLTTTVESGFVSFNGNQRPLPTAGQVSTLKFDKDGKLVPDAKSPPARSRLSGLFQMTRLNGVTGEPMKVGDTKSFDYTVGPDGHHQRTTGNMTLVAVEKAAGSVPVETVEIKSTADVVDPDDPAAKPAHVESISWIEPGTGLLVKADGTVTGIRIGPMATQAAAHFTRTLLPTATSAKS